VYGQDITILTGDVVKFALGLVSILYCLLLAGQHYLMYQEGTNKLEDLEGGPRGPPGG